MSAYYNEIDPYAAQWLRNLIAADLIAPGDVDERSIEDVKPDDVRGYTQAHFFAGIGGWSVALRLAGWPDDRPVWTGSCPCQPFSAAGAGKAADDERHLWPAWFPLISECRPPIIFGEQVEAAIGWGWLDAVFDDLETEGYACGEAVLPACSVGAFHIRQRTWFVADRTLGGWRKERPFTGGKRAGNCAKGITAGLESSGIVGGLAHANGGHSGAKGIQRGGEYGQRTQDCGPSGAAITSSAERGTRRPEWTGENGVGAHSEFAGSSDARRLADSECNDRRADEPGPRPQRRNAYGWIDSWTCDWLPCTDGKARPVRPGSFPLAHGIQRRASKLRAYGNAIVPQVAAEFIKAITE